MRLLALGFTALAVAAPTYTEAGLWLPTNVGNGADAEVRESNPVQNRGSSTEIGSRVKNEFIAGDPNDGADRNSAIYTKFDLTGQSMPADGHTAFRMSYRNNNLAGRRIQDTITPNPDVRTGLAIYGLKPDAVRGDWDESTITYLNAPGITYDGDVGTKDFNSDLVFLGTVAFPEIGTQNWLPVGGFLEFRSANLDAFLSDAFIDSQSSITLVSTVIHGGDTPFTDWINFNYLFNPKEQTTLNSDPNYDPGNGNLGSPYGTDNSSGAFSPQILVLPEPTSATLLGTLALAGLRRRR